MNNNASREIQIGPFLLLHAALTLYIIIVETVTYGLIRPPMEPMTLSASEFFTLLLLYSPFIFLGLLIFYITVAWIKKRFVRASLSIPYAIVVGVFFTGLYLVITQPILHDRLSYFAYFPIPVTAYFLLLIARKWVR
ncbi:hypothetical protein [Paenibacillus turpanensis]|uniref:hypothetical protein n=1 Tax=Paenibacillus turpanensis TaxID=2689078 RepID=UPI00140E467A|nr:hypothetical protein [Paenibacillus turpanensis]